MKKFISYAAFLGLLEISLAVYLTFWRSSFWEAVSQRDLHTFSVDLVIFAVVALVLCAVSSLSTYFLTLSAIKWREKLNKKAVFVQDSRIENVNQRIQSDCQEYADLFLSITFGVGKAVVYIATFSVALLWQFKAWYLLTIVIYAIIATFIAKKIATPLVALNYKSQAAEATYRQQLTVNNFENCIEIMLGLARKTKHLNYFQTFYAQIGVILPILIVAPDYFAGVLTFGLLMQATSTLSTIENNCSYGITSFSIINRLLSCRNRLKELEVI